VVAFVPLDTVESGQPFLLPERLRCRHEMPAQVAVRSMRQRKGGLLGKTAKHQGKSAEGGKLLSQRLPAPANRAQMCRRRDRERSKQRNRPLRGPASVKTGSEEHERLPHSLSGAMKKIRKKRNRGASAKRDSASQIGLTTHETLGPSVKRPLSFARLGEVCRIRCARPRVKFPPDV
jgi:hypothetical protein